MTYSLARVPRRTTPMTRSAVTLSRFALRAGYLLGRYIFQPTSQLLESQECDDHEGCLPRRNILQAASERASTKAPKMLQSRRGASVLCKVTFKRLRRPPQGRAIARARTRSLATSPRLTARSITISRATSHRTVAAATAGPPATASMNLAATTTTATTIRTRIHGDHYNLYVRTACTRTE